MVRRSSRLQAGHYYTVSNGHNSTPVATISYYETPVRYVHLNSSCGMCKLSRKCKRVCVCVFLFPAGVTEGPMSEPPDRSVFCHPSPKASVSVRALWGFWGAMLSSFSLSHLLPQVSNQSPAQLDQDAGAEPLIPSFLLNVSVDSSQSYSLFGNCVFPLVCFCPPCSK